MKKRNQKIDFEYVWLSVLRERVNKWWKKSAIKYYFDDEIKPDDSIMLLWSFFIGIMWGSVIYLIPVLSFFVIIAVLTSNMFMLQAIPLLIPVFWALGFPYYAFLSFKFYHHYIENTQELRGKNIK